MRRAIHHQSAAIRNGVRKGVQVKCMGRIYRNAEKVIIWLGEAEDNKDTAKAYAYMKLLSERVTPRLAIDSLWAGRDAGIGIISHLRLAHNH